MVRRLSPIPQIRVAKTGPEIQSHADAPEFGVRTRVPRSAGRYGGDCGREPLPIGAWLVAAGLVGGYPRVILGTT